METALVNEPSVTTNTDITESKATETSVTDVKVESDSSEDKVKTNMVLDSVSPDENEVSQTEESLNVIDSKKCFSDLNDTMNGKGKENKDIENVKEEEIDIMTVEKTPKLKRKIIRKSWSKEEASPQTPLKKSKGGLRADCPTFCRAGCTNTHHELLIYARRMIENDSSTTMVFLERVTEHYDGSIDTMKPGDIIFDPWKDTRYPLLHYLALMGKCAGSFALADAGHDPLTVVAENGDTVLHTMVREMYNFNCTHGHMDILLKKFKLLLREFKSCMFVLNYERDTPLHVCAQMILNTVKLLSATGRSKPPFRLYQFLKNMMTACLEIISEEDSEKLSMQNICGFTVAHYIAQDRASSYLLDIIKEKGANFDLQTVDKKTVTELQESAPPAPSDDILELAVFSAKGNKYKTSASKKPKYSPVIYSADRGSPLKKRQIKPPSKFSEQDHFSPDPKRPRIKVTKTKSERRASVKKAEREEENDIPTNRLIVKLPISKNQSKQVTMGVQNLKAEHKSNVNTLQEESKLIINTGIKKENFVAANNKLVTESPLAILSEKIKGNKKTSDNDIVPSMVDAKKTIPSSDVKQTVKHILPHQIKLPPAIKAQPFTTQFLPQTTNSSVLYNLAQKTQLQITSPTSFALASQSLSGSKPDSPVIKNVHSLKGTSTTATRNEPFFVYNPSQQVISSNLTTPTQTFQQRNLLTSPQGISPMLRNIRPTLPSNIQNLQQPLIFKTTDGKVMSINLMQVNNGGVNNVKPSLTLNPNIPHQTFQQMNSSNFGRPHNVRYVFNPGPSNHPQVRMRNASNMLRHAYNNRPQNSPVYPYPMMMNSPSMAVTSNNVNISQQTYNPYINSFPQRPLISQPLNNQFICPPELRNVSKADEKKFKSLEASIKNLHNSVSIGSKPPIITSLACKVESAPPVIILDNDDVEIRDSKYSNSKIKSPVSSDKVSSTSNIDPDNMVMVIKNYLQEKGSISDFMKYSQEKKNSLLQNLQEERQRIGDVNKEIINRENELASTRENIVEKEMEIAQLRLKVSNMISYLQPLRTKRNELVDSCSSIEKRIKAVDERTELFQSFAIEKTS